MTMREMTHHAAPIDAAPREMPMTARRIVTTQARGLMQSECCYRMGGSAGIAYYDSQNSSDPPPPNAAPTPRFHAFHSFPRSVLRWRKPRLHADPLRDAPGPPGCAPEEAPL